MKQNAPNRCEPSIEVWARRGGGSHGAYAQKIKVIAKMLKKSWVGGGVGGGSGWYEQRIEVIVKIAKKKLRGGGSSPGVEWGSEWMRTMF